jgi:UDP-N-acetylmuramyl tripeptide synthase
MTSSRRLKMMATTGPRNNDFLRLVERTEDALTTDDDPAVEDVRRILTDVRTQFDHVHREAEKKETELQHLREAIRVADQAGSARDGESSKNDDHRNSIQKQF